MCQLSAYKISTGLDSNFKLIKNINLLKLQFLKFIICKSLNYYVIFRVCPYNRFLIFNILMSHWYHTICTYKHISLHKNEMM